MYNRDIRVVYLTEASRGVIKKFEGVNRNSTCVTRHDRAVSGTVQVSEAAKKCMLPRTIL